MLYSCFVVSFLFLMFDLGVCAIHPRAMAPRLQLEKAAWRWVESVKPEDIKQEHIDLAYRVNLPACIRGTCRYGVKKIPITLTWFCKCITCYHSQDTCIVSWPGHVRGEMLMFSERLIKVAIECKITYIVHLSRKL